MKDIVFICGAKDFHAIDKVLLTSKAIKSRKIILLTDHIDEETKVRLRNYSIQIESLFNIDPYLILISSSFGNLWRNLIKILLLPIQLYYLKKFYKNHADCIFHAIPMYYMLLCYLAKIPFIGTPQGSEILVRTAKSKLYSKYAIKTLKKARHIVVDSVNMKQKILDLSDVEATILKNGFNTDELLSNDVNLKRQLILSMRGLNPIYRIDEIFRSRNRVSSLPISLVYPAYESDYKKIITAEFIEKDNDLGKMNKVELYKLMKETLLAISIPQSDSSPRSVYECVFAGACVAVTHNQYIHELPECMRNRIFVVNLEEPDWFNMAIEYALEVTREPFVPCERALDICDENRTIQKVIERIYT